MSERIYGLVDAPRDEALRLARAYVNDVRYIGQNRRGESVLRFRMGEYDDVLRFWTTGRLVRTGSMWELLGAGRLEDAGA